MSSMLNNLSVVHDINAITIFYSGQTMCNENTGKFLVVIENSIFMLTSSNN